MIDRAVEFIFVCLKTLIGDIAELLLTKPLDDGNA